MKTDTVAWISLAAIALGAGIAVAIARRKSTISAPPAVRPPPPVDVPLPEGWKRFDGTVTPAMTHLAQQVLAAKRPLGDLQPSIVEGRQIGAFTELHFDNHVDNEWKWHRGVSLLTKDVTA